MHRPLPHFICITLFTTLVISFVCLPAHPVNAGYAAYDTDSFRTFTLQDLNAALELRYEYENDENRRPRREGDDLDPDVNWEQKRNLFEERLTIDTTGAVYHKNFLEFTAESTVGLRQEDRYGDFDDDQDETLWEYDVNLNFLQEKDFNFNLFANQFSTRIDQDVFETTEVDTQSYGAFFQYFNDLFPSSLFILTQDVDEDTGRYTRDREEDKVEFKVSNDWRGFIKSDLRYTYNKTTDEVITEFEHIRNDVMLVNVIDYLNLHGTSTVFNYNTSGDIDTNQFQIIEHFYLDHSDTFRTLYNFTYSRFTNDTISSEDFTSNLYQGSFGFLHRLYQSLETELKGEFSVIDEDDFEEYYYGPRLDLDYRKNVPGGIFSAGWGFMYRVTDRDIEYRANEDNTRRIFNEIITLIDGMRVVLSNTNILASSIVVKNGERRILTEGVDYRVVERGNIIEIRRVGITNNSTLHVDYDYAVSPDLTYTTLGNTLYLRYDLKQFFTLYYSLNHIDYHLRSGYVRDDTVNFLSDTKSNTYGAEVKWRWFFFNAEYEDDTSDLIPFEAVRFNGRFQINPTTSTLLSINGDHTKTDYKDDVGDVTYDSVYATINAQISPRINTDLEVAYIREDGTNIDDRGWRASWDVSSRFRSLTVEFKADYYDWDRIREKRENLRLELRLIRYFDIL